MKKVSHLFLFFLLFILSCASDDRSKETDSSPTEATNIKIEVTPLTSTVTITWNAATDEDNDPIRYDVSINKDPVKTNLSTTSVEIDIAQFLPTTGKQAGKNGLKNFLADKTGLEVVLEIEIKAYDPKGNFSTNSITETVRINRSPSDFAFENIYFDTDAYNLLQISWAPSTDADNDPLFYTIYLNDIVIAKDYQIPSGEALGSVAYTEDFLDLSDEEMTVRTVVTDKSEETKEISASFDFKETDVDLGALEVPYIEAVQFNISETEPDNKVGYRFSVADQTNFSIGNNENVTMQLKDAQNNTLFSATSFEGVLEAGAYILIVIGNENSNSSGTINFDLTNSLSTDVNLGVLTLPSENDIDFIIEDEVDNIINYYFELTKPTGYIITSRLLPDSALYNENGDLIDDNSGQYGNTDMFMDEIPAGKYRLAINSDFNTVGTFKIYLKNSTETDQNLGVLANNATHELSFVPDAEFNFEPDRAVRIYFEVEEKTGLIISPGNYAAAVLLSIRDLEDTIYANVSSNGYHKLIEFEPGLYFLQVDLSRYVDLNAIIQRITLQNPTLTDADWGLLPVPSEMNGDTDVEPDDKVVYTFETSEVSPKWYYTTSDNSGDTVSFTDEAGNEVPRNGNHPSGEGEAGVDLPVGKYRIEVIDGKGVGGPGYGISFRFSLY